MPCSADPWQSIPLAHITKMGTKQDGPAWRQGQEENERKQARLDKCDDETRKARTRDR